MEPINRHDPSAKAATVRLLSSVAVSISLHGAAACFVPGPALPDNLSTLPAQLVLPFVETHVLPSPAVSAIESKPMVTLRSQDERSGLASIETIDPTYYAVEELDVFPAPLRPIKPVGNAHAGGRVRMLVAIDASGRVTRTGIFDSDATAIEDAAAMFVISRTRFSPARRKGRKVRSEVVIELR